jgi:hypothetical protein
MDIGSQPCFLLSFPRRRESIWPLQFSMDSRLRGNDNTTGILKTTKKDAYDRRRYRRGEP